MSPAITVAQTLRNELVAKEGWPGSGKHISVQILTIKERGGGVSFTFVGGMTVLVELVGNKRNESDSERWGITKATARHYPRLEGFSGQNLGAKVTRVFNREDLIQLKKSPLGWSQPHVI